MIAALLGFPGSGKRTLVGWLSAELPHVTVIDGGTFRNTLSNSRSEAARAARSASSAGALISDDLFGAILAECVRSGPHPVVLLGMPRNLAQLQRFEVDSGSELDVIYLRASPALIDSRRIAAGAQAIEHAHPGALARLDAALAPILEHTARRHRLLELDASSPVADLGTTVLSLLQAG